MTSASGYAWPFLLLNAAGWLALFFFVHNSGVPTARTIEPTSTSNLRLVGVLPAAETWHTVQEDGLQNASQTRRVIGELLGMALQAALSSYRQPVDTVPPLKFDTVACDAAGTLLTQLWNVTQVSFNNMSHAAIFGGRESLAESSWTLCETHPRKCTVQPALTRTVLRKIGSILVFDYLLWNFNRFKFKPPFKRRYAQNVFVRSRTAEQPNPVSHIALVDEPLVFIDNEFASHSDAPWIKSDVCKTFPEYAQKASFKSYVQTAAGYAVTADAALGCPLEPTLIADLGRYRSGAAFADAVLSALRPVGSTCIEHLWNQTFDPRRCPSLPAYLAARHHSLVVGLREWGCNEKV